MSLFRFVSGGRSRSVALMAPLAIALGLASAVSAQPPSPVPAPPRSAREAARADLAGNWVAQVTEDWRWRTITPPKGDYASVPLNAEGRKVADGWDLARDAAAGEQCRAFGAGGIMRQPTRLRIGWADADTLRVKTDAGQQTRLFRFARGRAPAAGARLGGRVPGGSPPEPERRSESAVPLTGTQRSIASAKFGQVGIEGKASPVVVEGWSRAVGEG